MGYMQNPKQIEQTSFEIIDRIIQSEHSGHRFSSDLERDIVFRCIHTSADFDYLYTLKISPDFEEALDQALACQATFFTDTHMALSGINRQALERSGCQARSLVAEAQTAKLAQDKKITRSMAGMERISQIPGPKVLVCGNAPTFLFRALELQSQKETQILAIIGVPVGFVGAAESKEALAASKVPHLAALGRKGGSNIAAAILNAFFYHKTGR